MLTKLALRGRIITLLLMIAVIAGGLYSLTKLQIELLPDIEFPALTISAYYPEASPDDVATDVSIPIEEALDGIGEITTVQTVSAPSVSQVIIQTDFGEDMAGLEAEINRRLAGVQFPEGVDPEVARINPDEFPVIELAIVGDEDISELVDLVRTEIVPELEAIPGVFSADIPLGLEDGASIARANGRPAVTLSILKDPDANTIEVADKVDDRLKELEAGLSGDVQFIEISNQAPAIQASIDELTQHVLLGAVFAVIVMFSFLLSVRPTIISSVAIPVSVFAALIIMQLQGMSLNILTLGGLAIAVGRVVDDSIVVIENIFRHIQKGETPAAAALNGAREVAVPITASTLTTVAVFAPLALIGGFIGIIFQPFALVVTYSLLASLIVALTIVPVLAVLFIKRAPEHKENILERVYTRIVRGALARRWRTLGAAAALTLLALVLVPFIPVNFIGSADTGALTIRITATGATDRQEVLDELEAVEQVLAQMEEDGIVENYSANYGGSNAFGGQSSANSATLQVALTEDVDTVETAEELRETLPTPTRQVSVSTVAAGGPDSSALELIIKGDDYQAMLAAANDYAALISEIDGVVNVSHNGVDTSAGGGLAALAPIIRVDGERAITISGTITTDNTGAVNVEVERIKQENPLPEGIEIATGGVFEDIDEAFQQMGIAMAISVVLVYVVMVITQRSFVIPFVIVLSLPLALIGAFGGLFITQNALGLPALMGLLMLIGLVVTNAIVLIAFVEQLRARGGMGMYEALVEGGRTRLRPILMTAFTTTFVLLPMALSLGGGEGGGIIGKELATVVIGGILASTFLTLVVLPVVYSFLRKKGPKLTAEAAAIGAEPGVSGASPEAAGD